MRSTLPPAVLHVLHRSYSLDSLKGGCKGDDIGIGLIMGHTRSLPSSSYGLFSSLGLFGFQIILRHLLSRGTEMGH